MATVDARKMILLMEILESSDSSDDDMVVELLLRDKATKPKVSGYIEDVVHNYSDEEFRKNFRLERSTCQKVIQDFHQSPFCPTDTTHGGLERLSAETHILSFSWFAGNKSCIRDVANRFGIGESSFHRVLHRVMDFLVNIAPNIIKFPNTVEGKEKLAADFKKLSGFPDVVGCIDGTYLPIRTPAHKIRSTYVNRHDQISITMQGICDANLKYLREVTPYFRKASIISEVGWELQRGFLSGTPPTPHSPQRADTRYLPLQLCYLVRNYRFPDPENRTLELHSPDGVHNCVLRASDTTEATAWFNTLHSALNVLTLQALQEANRLLGALLGELQHIGWLARKTPTENGRMTSSESSDDSERWQSIFAAVTEREFRIYEAAPWSPEAWNAPVHICPLLATRLVSSNRQTDVITFSVRCGTGEGIVTHQLRAETHRDLANWARALVQGSISSVQSQRELTCRCLWQGQPTQLILHYENGFSLIEVINTLSSREPRTLWKFPFERLKQSGDDGARLLWLDFGGEEGELELDLESCPKPLVFILHNFLSAKIHRLGLYA